MITNNVRSAGPYAGNGATTNYAYNFVIFTAADLNVLYTDASLNVSSLVLGVDYTVTINADQDGNPGGSVVLTNPLATGTTLYIASNVAQTQLVKFLNMGAYNPSTLNAALDKLTVLIQQFGLTLGRSLQVPQGDTAVNLTLPSVAARANQGLAFDATGQPIAGVLTSSVFSAAMTAVVQAVSIAAARVALGLGTASTLNAAGTNPVTALSAQAGLITDGTNLYAAIHGKCYLAYTSAAALTLTPKDGSTVMVGGKIYSIAAAGLSIANTAVQIASLPGNVLTLTSGNLAANTNYFVGAQIVGGVLTPIFYPQSLFGHARDTTAGNAGVEVLTNLSTSALFTGSTLLGFVATNGSSQFSNMLTLSYFNPISKSTTTTLSAQLNPTNTGLAELSATLRINFLSFANRKVIFATAGGGQNGTAAQGILQAIAVDGAASGNIVVEKAEAINVSYYFAHDLILTAPVSEGMHYATFLTATVSGGQTSFFPAAPGTIPDGIKLSVTIDG